MTTRKIQVHQVDAFTRERFTGNPAGVVLNADGLSESQMLAIARELNNADTAFILAPDNSEHGMRARFFTPRTEVGFVGHATVAAHYVLSRRHTAPRYQRQKSKAGVVDIEIRGVEEDRSIAIRQTTPPMGREFNDRERLAVLDALALATDDLDPRCPLRIVGSSSTWLMIGVRNEEALKHLKPDLSRLTTLSAQLGAAGYFVFTLATTGGNHLTESRLFCLAHYGFLPRNEQRVSFSGVQGHQLHRPGRVNVELEIKDGTIEAVWIIGQAISIFETEIEL